MRLKVSMLSVLALILCLLAFQNCAPNVGSGFGGEAYEGREDKTYDITDIDGGSSNPDDDGQPGGNDGQIPSHGGGASGPPKEPPAVQYRCDAQNAYSIGLSSASFGLINPTNISQINIGMSNQLAVVIQGKGAGTTSYDLNNVLTPTGVKITKVSYVHQTKSLIFLIVLPGGSLSSVDLKCQAVSS